MLSHLPRARAAFSLIEMMVATGIFSALSLVIYSYVRSGTELYVRNASVNQSHHTLRGMVDRMSDAMQTAEDVPTLIDTNGAVVTTGPAAGVRYDRFIAEPYVLDPPMAAGSVASGATTLKVVRWIPAASPVSPPPVPLPAKGDVMVIDIPTGHVRAQINSVSAPTVVSGAQTITLSLTAPVSATISWSAGQAKQARLVRREAFLVMPGANGRRELRCYPSFEPMPSLNSAASYTVVTDELSTDAADATPFRIIDPTNTANPTEIKRERTLEVRLRAHARNYRTWLSSRQPGGFNTYTSITMRLPSRMHARTQQM